jgi:2-aminomuconate deaminase
VPNPTPHGTPALHSTSAPEPVGAYAHARRVGNLLFLAGIGPRVRGSTSIPGVTLAPDGSVLSYSIEDQVRSCFANVRAVLDEAGSSWASIVDVTVFMTDLRRDFPAFNRLWAEYFPSGPNCPPSPTRTTVEVARLPQAGSAPINFEIKVIATI